MAAAIVDGDISDAKIEALFVDFANKASQADPSSTVQLRPSLAAGSWFLHCFADLPDDSGTDMIPSAVFEVIDS